MTDTKTRGTLFWILKVNLNYTQNVVNGSSIRTVDFLITKSPEGLGKWMLWTFLTANIHEKREEIEASILYGLAQACSILHGAPSMMMQ